MRAHMKNSRIASKVSFYGLSNRKTPYSRKLSPLPRNRARSTHATINASEPSPVIIAATRIAYASNNRGAQAATYGSAITAT
jgi:hypothetical protein